MKLKKTWFDKAIQEFDCLSERARLLIIIISLILAGMIISNHTSMIDLINLALVLKELLQIKR